MDNNITFTRPLRTAVLFLVFNRPDATAQTFEAIRRAKPTRLYVAADGPRKYRKGEPELCSEVRRIATNIDWDCEIHTLLRSTNLGCRDAVNGGITWFFENEESGIIIEDDCVPSSGAIKLLDEALKKFSPDDYSAITGTNYITSNFNLPDGCFLENYYMALWGWATWRKNWHNYLCSKKKYSYWQVFKASMEQFSSFRLSNILATENRKKNRGVSKTWDYDWFIYNLMEHKPNIVYHKNLFENIGYDGAHATSRTENHNMPTYSIAIDPCDMFSTNKINYNHEIGKEKFSSSYKDKIKIMIRLCLNY